MERREEDDTLVRAQRLKGWRPYVHVYTLGYPTLDPLPSALLQLMLAFVY